LKLIFQFFVTNHFRQPYYLKIFTMKKLIVLLFVLSSLYSFAQNDAVINDPNVQKRVLNESFSGISVSDGVDLYLTQGNEEMIAVSAADPKYLERYKTEVNNGILKIYYDNQGINWSGNEKRKLKAYVSFKQLQKLSASGGAEVIMKSILTANKMEYTFTSGSRFTGEVNINQLDVTENSGALVEINGKNDDLKIEVSSGAMFKGYELVTDFCDAKATSGGSARITVNKELVVKANSGGGIHYKGNGIVKDMNVNSGGSVKKG
jgi:Putative auto-transporter adhesin, head GIN domain